MSTISSCITPIDIAYNTCKRVFVCLVLNGTSTLDRSICANCGRVKPTQWAKDGQRDIMHNSQYVTQRSTVHNKTLQLQKCNNRLSNRMTYLLKYHVSAFTNTKSDHTLPVRYNNLQSSSEVYDRVNK